MINHWNNCFIWAKWDRVWRHKRNVSRLNCNDWARKTRFVFSRNFDFIFNFFKKKIYCVEIDSDFERLRLRLHIQWVKRMCARHQSQPPMTTKMKIKTIKNNNLFFFYLICWDWEIQLQKKKTFRIFNFIFRFYWCFGRTYCVRNISRFQFKPARLAATTTASTTTAPPPPQPSCSTESTTTL